MSPRAVRPSSSRTSDQDERPESYSSIVTYEELLAYRERFSFPSSLSYKKPERNEKANSPPQGYATVYHRSLVLGLRFPLLPLLEDLLGHYKLQLGQLHPNCIITVLGFYH